MVRSLSIVNEARIHSGVNGVRLTLYHGKKNPVCLNKYRRELTKQLSLVKVGKMELWSPREGKQMR